MKFENHVFISYAHDDNSPVANIPLGWISQFKDDLESFLKSRFDSHTRIWKDDALRSMDVFSNEIQDQLGRSALLLSVLSPAYIKKEWFAKELDMFCRHAVETGGLGVGNSRRIIKVSKLPVDRTMLPKVMQDMLGVEFYKPAEGGDVELAPSLEGHRELYFLRMNKLAWDIAEVLKKMGAAESGETAMADRPAGSGENAADAPSQKPAIYLAECAYDLSVEREALAGELSLHGYVILPEDTLPRDEKSYVAEVDRLMGLSGLSVHFVGNMLGWVPDGPSQTPAVMLQNEIAAAHSREKNLARLIWAPGLDASQSAGESGFVTSLLGDADLQFGADVITGDMEKLKAATHDTLKRIMRKRQAETEHDVSTDARERMIYLVCGERDREQTLPLVKALRKAGLVVKLPIFEGDAGSIRRANETLCCDCHAGVIFYGAGDEAWKFHKENELKKAIAAANDPTPPVILTCLAPPATDSKKFLVELEEPGVINCMDGSFEAAAATVLKALDAGNGHS